MAHRVLEAMRELHIEPVAIGGGKAVEIDETYLGGLEKKNMLTTVLTLDGVR